MDLDCVLIEIKFKWEVGYRQIDRHISQLPCAIRKRKSKRLGGRHSVCSEQRSPFEEMTCPRAVNTPANSSTEQRVNPKVWGPPRLHPAGVTGTPVWLDPSREQKDER